MGRGVETGVEGCHRVELMRCVPGYMELVEGIITRAGQDWQRYGPEGRYATYLEHLRAFNCVCEKAPITCKECSCDRELIAFWNSPWAAWLCDGVGLNIEKLRRKLEIPETRFDKIDGGWYTL